MFAKRDFTHFRLIRSFIMVQSHPIGVEQSFYFCKKRFASFRSHDPLFAQTVPMLESNRLAFHRPIGCGN